ncbi:uncharacterized protein LOC132306498 isoform X1 [Cornus florida]|uniref:uncharacterized protein LOC132306498 isoform X1 n=1 Tax=Cornus florida TaxID=4283 RepID=UPI00289ED245|nr:uncharacterized protein LOC132306498 isoform X1 [Cornus florida]
MMILNHPQWVRTHKFQIHRKPSSVSGEVAPPNPHRPPRSGSCGVVSMKRLKSSLRRRISVKNANNQSSPIASHQVSPSEDLVGKCCELLHFHGTKSVVAKGEIDSMDPDSLIRSAPLGSDYWRVWITDLIDHSVPLYRPEIRGFDLKDAYVRGFSIAWPIKYIKVCES